MVSGVSNILILLDFQKMRYGKICSKMFPYFLFIFLNILVINTGSPGRDSVNIFEVSQIIRNMLQYVRGP